MSDQESIQSKAVRFEKGNRDVLRTLQPGAWYFALLAFCLMVIALGVWAWSRQVVQGLGVTGLRHAVMWGAYITQDCIQDIFLVGSQLKS